MTATHAMLGLDYRNRCAAYLLEEVNLQRRSKVKKLFSILIMIMIFSFPLDSANALQFKFNSEECNPLLETFKCVGDAQIASTILGKSESGNTISTGLMTRPLFKMVVEKYSIGEVGLLTFALTGSSSTDVGARMTTVPWIGPITYMNFSPLFGRNFVDDNWQIGAVYSFTFMTGSTVQVLLKGLEVLGIKQAT